MLFMTGLIWVCTICLGLSVLIIRIITVRKYGILALDRISCAMGWSFVVRNLTLSGIITKFP